MFGLGIWQLERKVEKDERLQQIAERKSNQPYKLEEILNRLTRNTVDPKMADIQDFPVTFLGKAHTDELFFIDNKIVAGKTGYQVLVPIETLSGFTVLANFGWLRGTNIRGDYPTLPTEFYALNKNSFSEFNGVLSFPTINKMVSETNTEFGQFPVLLQQIDTHEIEQHLSASSLTNETKLYPIVVNLAPNTNSEFVRNWQPVVMSPEKHLGYAAQWFGLGIAALTIYLLSLMKLFQTKNNKEN
jgi:cytochrome oxidase assembly protein ShyY1